MKNILIGVLLLFLFPLNIKGEELSFAENAKSAIMIEASTGDIIFEKNADEKLAPASMTKIMTMLLIVEAIDNNILSWDQMIMVSANASSMGGSQILLETNEKMSVEDLFKGIAIASGNDSAVALAEAIAGSETVFVQMMNNKAKELNLKGTNFKNVHGLDETNHYSTARDMAIMAKELVKHEKVLEYTSIYETYLRQDLPTKVWLVNTNKLVRFYDGVDGLKTGFTSSAGYCLTATAKKKGMRIITVVMGEPDSNTRNAEIRELLDYAFAQYEVESLLNKEQIIDNVRVEKGKNKKINIVPIEDVNVLHKKIDTKKEYTYETSINNIKAPLNKGDVVGKISILENGKKIRDVNLTVDKNIEKANILKLYFRYLKDVLTGNIIFD